MKARICLLGACLLAFLLSACKIPSQNITPATETIAPRELVFQISDQFDPEVVLQADRFSDQVQQLSGGRLTIKVLAQVPDVQELAQGKYDLALFRNVQLAQHHAAFSTFSLPFLYNSQKHMSAVLNSDEMLSRLQGMLQPVGLRPLAALYFGSYTLVSDREGLRIPQDFEGRIVALRTSNAEKMATFEKLGARVLPYSQDSLAGLLGTEVATPPDSMQGIAAVTIDTVEINLVQALDIPVDSRPLYLMSPGHTISPVWMTINEQTWKSLSEWERAILAQAQAGLIAQLDSYFTARELQALDTLLKRGGTVASLERELLADAVYGRAEANALPEYFNYKLYTLIQSYN